MKSAAARIEQQRAEFGEKFFLSFFFNLNGETNVLKWFWLYLVDRDRFLRDHNGGMGVGYSNILCSQNMLKGQTTANLTSGVRSCYANIVE